MGVPEASSFASTNPSLGEARLLEIEVSLDLAEGLFTQFTLLTKPEKGLRARHAERADGSYLPSSHARAADARSRLGSLPSRGPRDPGTRRDHAKEGGSGQGAQSVSKRESTVLDAMSLATISSFSPSAATLSPNARIKGGRVRLWKTSVAKMTANVKSAIIAPSEIAKSRVSRGSDSTRERAKRFPAFPGPRHHHWDYHVSGRSHQPQGFDFCEHG